MKTLKTLKEAVEEANLRKSNLYESNLYVADLREADLRGAYLSGAEMQNAKFYGKGGNTKIKKSQINDLLTALGIVVED